MIHGIKIRNFKSLGEDSGVLELKPITILIGPNSSGKSSFIKSLLAIKQTLESSDHSSALITTSTYLELGNYSDYVFKHNRNSSFKFEIKFWSNYKSLLWRKALKSKDELVDFTRPFTLSVEFYKPGETVNIKNILLTQNKDTIYSLYHVGRGSYEFYSSIFRISGNTKSRMYKPTKC